MALFARAACIGISLHHMYSFIMILAWGSWLSISKDDHYSTDRYFMTMVFRSEHRKPETIRSHRHKGGYFEAGFSVGRTYPSAIPVEPITSYHGPTDRVRCIRGGSSILQGRVLLLDRCRSPPKPFEEVCFSHLFACSRLTVEVNF